MPRVFFVQQPRQSFDLSNIGEFGDVTFILRTNDSPSLNAGLCLHKLRSILNEWTPEDYITAFGGDPLGVAMAGMLMNEMFPTKPIKWLRWNRKRDDDGVRYFGQGYYEEMAFKLDGKLVEGYWPR